jgi:hypothetical protein
VTVAPLYVSAVPKAQILTASSHCPLFGWEGVVKQDASQKTCLKMFCVGLFSRMEHRHPCWNCQLKKMSGHLFFQQKDFF